MQRAVKPKSKHWWRLGGVVLGAGAALAGVMAGCSHPQQTPPPEAAPSVQAKSVVESSVERKPECPVQPKPDDREIPRQCWEQQRIASVLAELAVRSMKAFGRIDPFVFEVPSGKRELVISRKVTGKSTAELDEVLKKVNADPAVLRAYLANKSAAVISCGKDCPPKVYDIQIERRRTFEEGGAVDHFEVRGDDLPTPTQWRSGFLRQYTLAQPECFPIIALIELDNIDELLLAKGYGSGNSAGGTASSGGGGNCQSDKSKCGGCTVGSGGPDGKWNKEGTNKYCCRGSC